MNRIIYQLKLDKENIEDEIKAIRRKEHDQQKRLIEAEDQVNRLQKNIDEFRRK